MSDFFNLHGKTAIVTGGAGILGRHFCSTLANAGAVVYLVDLPRAEPSSIAAEIMNLHGGTVRGKSVDITCPKQVTSLIKDIMSEAPRIDILHNNAASKSSDLSKFFLPFEEFPLDTWREVMSVNIDAMFLMAQAVGKRMVADGLGGSIIQTASIYGVVAPDQRIYEGSGYLGMAINTPAVYSTSKSAVIGLTKYLATYWAQQRIRVNSLTPGGIESGQNSTFKEKYSARVPMGRMGKAEELGAALLFLASDASSYVTGQNLIVDGGLTVW